MEAHGSSKCHSLLQSHPWDPGTAKQEKEFKISSVGLSDSIGITLVVLASVPLELSLCTAQVKRGKELCHSS